MDQRFTEKQGAEVLRKAVELQAQASGGGTSEAISGDALKGIAREIGIDEKYVNQAMQSLEVDCAQKPGIMGGPMFTSFERVVEGQITAEKWEDVIAVLRKIFGEAGEITVRGSTFEWIAKAGGMHTTSVVVRQVGSSVRIESSLQTSPLATLMYAVSIFPNVMAPALVALFTPAQFHWPLGIASVGGILATVRQIHIGTTRRLVQQLSDAMKLCENIVQKSSLTDHLASATQVLIQESETQIQKGNAGV